VAFDPGSFPILLADNKTENFALLRGMRVHKYEVARAAMFFYDQWCGKDIQRQRLFAHPDEPAIATTMAEFASIDIDKSGSYPVLATYWAAFRIAGFLGCRLPTAREWLLAAQDGKRDTVPAKPESYSPENSQKREVDWKNTRLWDSTGRDIRNMFSYPSEWTTTQASVSRASLSQFMWCFFDDPYHETNPDFAPRPYDNAPLPIEGGAKSKRGFRLVRDLFHPAEH